MLSSGAAGAGGAAEAAGAGGAGAAGAGGAGAAGTALPIPFFYPQLQSSLPPPDSVLLQRLEHRTKHIALRYFLAHELQQRRQLRLSYVVSRANTADVFTKALGSGDHQRFCTALGLVPILPYLLVA
ncbi:unnamed protein product [Closterium sp. NIES-54]